jgi:CRISPR-associated endonuclease Csn1
VIIRILGVDLGISSFGWAIIEYDTEKDTYRIIDCGVRLFTAAENPKNHKSLNEERRKARGTRKLIKRKKLRMNQIKDLCVSYDLISPDDLNIEEGIFNSKSNRTDVWKLRHDAIFRSLTPNELARVMIHIAKHRGFKFVVDTEDNKETGAIKIASKKLNDAFEKSGCLTIGEFLWAEAPENGQKRNKSVYNEKTKQGDPTYDFSIHRDLFQYEIETIFSKQQSFGNSFASDQLLNDWKKIALFVRNMKSVESLVGYCTFFPRHEIKRISGEKRAPKASPTAERFIALGKFFNTIVIDENNNEKKLVELKSIDALMDFAQSKDAIKFKQLRKFLKLNDSSTFKSVKDEGTIWIKLSGNDLLKKTLSPEMYKNFIDNVDIADEVIKVLSYYKATTQKEEQLKTLLENVSWIDAETIQQLSKLSFTAFTNLSIKALKILNKIMADGYLRYDEAVKYAFEEGLFPPKENDKKILLPALKETNIAVLNPTVLRAFGEFRKVANALVKKYGSFDKVHFELARNVNTQSEIKEINKGIAKNTKERAAANEWMSTNFPGIPTTAKNILKKRLFDQQNGICPYTSERIELKDLFNDGMFEVDHILPRSRSADDSQSNKVLCLRQANQEKANRTPFEWFGHDIERWTRFEENMRSSSNIAKMGMGKVNRLTKKNFDKNSETEFSSRNLNDTRYMSKAIKSYCEDYWLLAQDDDKLRIQVRSGKLTSTLRYQWGLDNKNRDVNTHHAEDAIIIALSTQGMVQKLSEFYKFQELNTGIKNPVFKAPMENFREIVEAAIALERTETIVSKAGDLVELNRIIISKPPRAGVTGEAHAATYYSPITKTVKKPDGSLTLLSDNEYRRSILTGSGLGKIGSMVRRDVFYVNGKLEIVPIYVHDLASKKPLPNKTLDGRELESNAQFYCSLHNNDLIKVTLKGIEYFGYLKYIESKGRLHMESIDGSQIFMLSLLKASIKKYNVDLLGYYHEVKGEKRRGTIHDQAKERVSCK